MELSVKEKISRNVATLVVWSAAVACLTILILYANSGTALAAAGSSAVVLNASVSGGTAVASDFTVQIKNSVNNIGTLTGAGNTITFSSLQPGTYTLSEVSGPSGYVPVWGGDCNAQGTVTIAANATARCTVTYTFGSFGTIQVLEVVSGGTAKPTDYTVHLKKSGQTDTGSPSGSGAVVTFGQLAPGGYTIIEAGGPATGYNTTWSGACNSQGNITVSSNTTSTCTITHTFVPPTTGGGSGGSGSGRGDRPTPPPIPPRPTR